MSARLPPADKLTLAVRKGLRDSFESEKEENQTELSRILGEKWTIDIDPLILFPYCGNDRLGYTINSYIEGALYKLKYVTENADEELKQEINGICHTHSLTLDVDEKNSVSYCGCEIVDGKLEMRFNSKSFGTNSGDCLNKDALFAALNRAAPAPSKDLAMNFYARNSLRSEYQPKIEAQRKELAELLQCEDLKFNPNFEDAYAKLTVAGKQVDKDWDQRIGYYVYSYFEGLVYKMKYLKFGEDEMLREGFLEAVEKHEVAFRVVDKLQNASYCEAIVEDGVLYLQTIPSKYGVNVGEAADKLIDQL